MPEPAPLAGRPLPAPGTSEAPLDETGGDGGRNPRANGRAAADGNASSPSPSSLRRAIVLHLRRAGPTAPDALAAALGASRTGVLQQLRSLEEARLVTHVPEKHGVGRPRHLYDVTADAQELFPADYDGFARGILSAIVAVGGDDLLEEVFAARRRQIAAGLRDRLDGALGPDVALPERVRQLAVIQSARGYIAEAAAAPDGTVLLRENNCAIHRLALESTRCCDAELELFREVLGVEVSRESHIASGDRSCTYRISERPPD